MAATSSRLATVQLLARIGQLEPGGIGASPADRAEVDALARAVEALPSPYRAPATSDATAALDGLWRVVYADAPPPSNGQLGPLRGAAFQFVDVAARVYENDLRVGSTARPWLRARLRADWDALGPDTWRVNFRTIRFSVLGQEIFSRAFPEGTTRVWRFSYSSPDVRLVRAGQGDGKVSDVGRALRVVETGKFEDCLFVLMRVSDPMP